MSFLETIVFADIVQIIPTNDDRSCHFKFHHDTSEDTSTDADVACKWAFLIDVGTFDGLEKIKTSMMSYWMHRYSVSLTSRGVLKPKPTLRV